MKKTVAIIIILALVSCNRSNEVKPSTITAPGSAMKHATSESMGIVPVLIAGDPNYHGDVDRDGIGSAARFQSLQGICVAKDGSLYVVESVSPAYCLRQISAEHEVTTLNVHNWHEQGHLVLYTYPNSVAILNDGTVGITSPLEIVLYKSGSFQKDFAVGELTSVYGIDKDPSGDFFWYIKRTPNGNQHDSYLGAIVNKELQTPQRLKFGSLPITFNVISTCANDDKYFAALDDNNHCMLFKKTKSGIMEHIFINLHFDLITAIAVNHDGSEVYIADNGNVKRIKHNVLTTLLPSGQAEAEGIALSNSEKSLYYTSDRRTVNRITLTE